MFAPKYRIFWSILFGIGAIIFIYVYKTFNPLDYGWFPKCPSKALTGLDCAGCGSQRAIHYLLNGEFKEAFHQNALLLPFIPYIALGLGYRFIKTPNETQLKWRKILFGETAIKIVGAVIVLYTVLRNVH